jgi:hypothetical protein
MAQQNQVSAFEQNIIARQNLLQSGVRMAKPMQVASADLGGQMIIPLDRTGILTAVELHVSIDYDIDTELVPSPVGPHNLLRRVQYTDFAGVNRTSAPGAFLYDYNSIRLGRPFNNVADDVENAATGLFNNPIEVGDGNTMYFVLRIPIAYDDYDLSGAVLAQTAVGQHYVTIDLAPALIGADPWLYPFVDGAVDAVSKVSVVAYQEYIQPQNLAGLPIMDLSTIYGIEGNYTTSDNIAAGQEKYINYPNMRSVKSAIIGYVNGDEMNSGTDIDRVRLIANSNVFILDGSPKYFLERMRNGLGGDLQPGVLYLGHRQQPINTTLYGNVQAALTPNLANPGAYIAYAFETMYPSGQALPGIAG